jgi:hypothetical protein
MPVYNFGDLKERGTALDEFAWLGSAHCVGVHSLLQSRQRFTNHLGVGAAELNAFDLLFAGACALVKADASSAIRHCKTASISVDAIT